MRRRVFPILLVIILISIVLSTLGAVSDYTVTYTPETFLQFKKGSDTPGYLSPATAANKFVGLLGTMELTVNTPPATMIHPAVLYTNGTTYFSFRGLRANPQPEMASFGFHIQAVTYINGNISPSYREPITQRVVFLTNQTTVNNISSLKVEFYFVSWENSSVFIPGKEYDLKTGIIGNFNLAVSSEGNIWNDPDYILLEGQTINPATNEPTTPVPIVGEGATSTIPSVPYVDDAHPPLLFLLSIINERTIDLSEAYGTGKTRVAKANIEIQNAQPGSEYKVNIKFESIIVPHGPFRLYLDGNPTLYSIPYTLFFKQQEVVPGELILWKHLKPGSTDTNNTKAIKVTGVAQIVAEAAPAGTYSDTITVTIIPVDTL